MRFLTVCTGNICRSPMAQAFLSRLFPDAVVESAGIAALVGHAADPLAVKCMGGRGFDIGGHVARQITADMLREADLVLVASREHQTFIERSHPWARGRVFRLGQWLGHDIDDPYQRGEAAFEVTCNAIQQALNTWVPRIQGKSSELDASPVHHSSLREA